MNRRKINNFITTPVQQQLYLKQELFADLVSESCTCHVAALIGWQVGVLVSRLLADLVSKSYTSRATGLIGW